MESNLYRKNVMKTLSVKPAKLGLALVSRNTELTNVFHAVVGLKTEVDELMKALRPYILGEQLSKLGKENIQEELGDAGYYLSVLAKVLKAKSISGKKKVKLQGTMTARLLDFNDLSGDMLDLVKKSFYGPKMVLREKEIRNPATGEKSLKTLPVLDKGAEKLVWDERKSKIKSLLELSMLLHAELCLALLGTTTAPVNAGNIAKLVKRYPEGFFEMESQVVRDTDSEMVAQGEATAAASAPKLPKVKALTKVGKTVAQPVEAATV